jgi:NodT family efflux transporter outer membrane factor (OMF) lipoprotein
VPSDLLQRRPDVAAAERTMAEANAAIGIARAAYFPDLTLSGAAGFESSTISKWFSWPSRFWSIGASAPETIFDAGLRRATVQQYDATYNADLANYRQTVLTAFQQVEDGLAEVRILSKEIQQEQQAVNSAETFLKLEQVRYDTGIDPYLNVLVAQTTVLSDLQTLNSLQVQEMTYAVALVQALGGGWDSSQLPGTHQVTQKPAASEAAIQQ